MSIYFFFYYASPECPENIKYNAYRHTQYRHSQKRIYLIRYNRLHKIPLSEKIFKKSTLFTGFFQIFQGINLTVQCKTSVSHIKLIYVQTFALYDQLSHICGKGHNRIGKSLYVLNTGNGKSLSFFHYQLMLCSFFFICLYSLFSFLYNQKITLRNKFSLSLYSGD